ncbi:MAG: ABC transporter permease [Firmicutes bacterium]|nr:ABC transporter permease [Bacillota bacterium]
MKLKQKKPRKKLTLNQRRKIQKSFALSFVFIVLAVMYVPILLIIVFSFTNTRSGRIGDWGGFSMQLYSNMLQNRELMGALGNTLMIAVLSALFATLLGTISAVGIHFLKRRVKAAAKTLNQIIVVNADIVTAVAFMLFFFVIGFRQFGYTTLILAHTMITMPFVILTVSPRLNQLNPSLYDAGLDLGAGPMRTLFKVILPQLIPAMIAAFAIAFTLSVDDFVVTKFNNGGASGLHTLSTYLYTSFKRPNVGQQLRALSSVIFILSFVVLLIINFRAKRKAKKARLPVVAPPTPTTTA